MDANFQVKKDDYLPLRDVVFSTLRQAILRGELRPGERLPEIHLANKLGVSRTPVREAIRKLELEGLVLMIPRRGAEVAQLTEKNMRDVLEVRRVLEELAVRKACANMTALEIEELKIAAEEFEEILKSDDVTKFAEADVKFHDVIYYAANNHRLIMLLHSFREQMYRYRVEYLKNVAVHDSLKKEHQDIIEKLEKRDEEGVVQAMCTHIDNQVKVVTDKIIYQKK